MIRYWLLVFTLGLVLATPSLAQRMATSSDARAGDNWKQLKQLLSSHVTLNVDEVPLVQVVGTLRKQHGVNILIDDAALEDLGLDRDEPVTVDVSGISLASLFDVMLEPLGLDWTFCHGEIFITSEEEAYSDLVTHVYPVPDLLGNDERGADYDTLMDVLISTIASDTWVENGGAEAEVRPFPAASALVISQTIRIHLEIEQLLADMRRVRGAQGRSVYRSRSSGDALLDRAPRARKPRTYIQPRGEWRVPRSYGDDGT